VDEEKFGCSRDGLIEVLEGKGIETRPFFIPVHTLPPYREQSRQRQEDLPVTQELSRVGMYLPSSTDLSDSEVDEVCEAVRSMMGNRT